MRALVLAIAVLGCLGLSGGAAVAQPQPGISSPEQMVRSLQFVQDAIVAGDHSAIEMQRHLLHLIDERLRELDPEVFSDPANVEAALIYALSGGNPATLSFLAGRDEAGLFDKDLVEAISAYLAGAGEAALEPLTAVLPKYKGTPLAPYLMLVTGNVASDEEPEMALALYDQVRLLGPGTILEEAALRRSIGIAVEEDRIEVGLAYTERYARRFLHSPYASQFADLFVELVLKHPETIEAKTISEILHNMDEDRRRSVYLRIARRAAIGGHEKLAVAASQAAGALGESNPKVRALADLYAGVAGVPSADILKASEQLDAIGDAALSARDRALRDAARRIADAVVRPPAPTLLSESLPAGEIPGDAPAAASPEGEMVAAAGDAPTGGLQATQSFVSSTRDMLESVDQLLEEDR